MFELDTITTNESEITMVIFLAGASRGLGREIAHCLVTQGRSVVAMLRKPQTQAELEAMGVTVVLADAFHLDQVQQAMTGRSIEAVITTVGGLLDDGLRSDYLGNRNLIDAAAALGIPRFILVSSIGVGASLSALPERARLALGAVLQEKEKAEHHLIHSGLNYTIIRPGGLKSEPATGQGILTENHHVSGTIHRADVAQLVCACLDSDRTHHKVLAAIDRHLLYGSPDVAEFHL